MVHDIVRKVLAVALALVAAVPETAFAEETRPSAGPFPVIVLVREPAAVDLRVRAPLLGEASTIPRSPRSPLMPSPAPRDVRLSEEGLVLVVASVIVGTVILVYLVSTATK
jgi:hypothetical protein